MKRKRKEDCSSPLLDDSPKRTKVHAQRKFAQGSNVNSPVITPVKEIERQELDILPEPVELLPMKRPNTEDFLTFLCFRGTPILPPNLNFFNTASIVDTNGQVHEIKGESPKNGPIDTSAISKTGSGSSERPFIAFGVRKRADPIVISRQMDKKRRHALTLQALRRKYQEQRMAKIRAVTISKLSEKVTAKAPVKTNSLIKTDSAGKKNIPVSKTKSETVTKQEKINSQPVKTGLRSKIKPKMCLRSFRGRFVQKELQFRNIKKKQLPAKKIDTGGKVQAAKKPNVDYSSEDDQPLAKASKITPKIAKKSAPAPKKPHEMNFRITRSKQFLSNKMVSRRQQIKQLILTTPKTMVKPRTLRSHTAQKTESPQKAKVVTNPKQKYIQLKKKNEVELSKTKASLRKNIADTKKTVKTNQTKNEVEVKVELVKEVSKKVAPKVVDAPKKEETASSEENVNSAKKSNKIIDKPKRNSKIIETLKRKEQERIKLDTKKLPQVPKTPAKVVPSKKPLGNKETDKSASIVKKDDKIVESTPKKDIPIKSEPAKTSDIPAKKEDPSKNGSVAKKSHKVIELRTSQRPTRKTKEAAAIYMEILSHKLVNESKIDDDNVSIDSFPELPNVKKTEQRENELKAKAKSSKNTEPEISDQKKDAKPKTLEVVETKTLRSSDKKKIVGCTENENESVAIEKEDKPVDNKHEKPELCAVVQEEVKTVTVKATVFEKSKTDIKKEAVLSKQAEKQTKNEESSAKKSLSKNTKDDVTTTSDRKTRSSNHTDKSEPNKESVPNETTNKKETKDLPAKRKPGKQSDADSASPPESKIKKTEDSQLKDEKVETQSDSKAVKSEDSNDVGKLEVKKSQDKTEVEVTKRQTRNSAQNAKSIESDDSDESFRVDVKIPKKRQVTRSKMSKTHSDDSSKSDKVDDKKIKTSNKSYRECSSSESDRSTTSDVNIRPLKPSNKAKRFTKTRSQKKSDQSFSDSDEEPLSKLTQSKSIDNKRPISDNAGTADSGKGIAVKGEVTDEVKDKSDVKKLDATSTPEKEAKPKRECAKRPQYYLPMFSSSEDDDKYFLGFKTKSDVKTKTTRAADGTHPPPTSDLSYKDIGRRFGKGKVNMSNEQIEKWIKDSAMAGSNLKCDTDQMLQFGEKIPTETSINIAKTLDTCQLKASLLVDSELKSNPNDTKRKSEILSKPSPSPQCNQSKNVVTKLAIVGDRKLIFRKDKNSAVRNVNAFSASNESSVYAFGEESDEIMKTPFRQLSRRPSSTATSRSEDECPKVEDSAKPAHFRKPLNKQDVTKLGKEAPSGDEPTEDNIESTHTENEDSDHLFYTPSQPSKPPAAGLSKILSKPSDKSTAMIPPSNVVQKTRLSEAKNTAKPGRSAELTDDFKYKVPSSPSASSSSSAKLYKKQNTKPKVRATIEVCPVKLPDFPVGSSTAQLVEAPTFHPTDKEFQDPLEYIQKIRAKAEQFGICRIVPPATFKPECKVTDDMRFTAYNQYVHKMLYRWGPNFKELMAIKKYLSTQNISLNQPPWIGGMEIDLPRLYQTVQMLGGLKEVIEKKKWPKVSDAMKIPKSAQDRVTKLDDIYCKYLLPYDTLSPAEREKLFDEVETEWAKRESKSLLQAQQSVQEENDSESESDDEAEECIVKGRNMALNAFYRIARNTMSMWFKNTEPLAQEVEQEYWKHLTQRQNHICVHSGSIDSGNWGYGFAVSKNSPFARHAWNLKVLTNNSGSVLRSLGPIMGLTVPTLHVGMVFSSCCWYRDPHSLPWIEYLHTGGNKIWYGIPNSTSAAFNLALKKLVPNYCRNKALWLPSDTVMVPPNLLIESGVSLSRIVQEPGQFIVVFPKVFTSSISTGYVVSESVYFAPPYWLNTARSVFNELRNSCEPSMFSLDRLLLSIVNDSRSSVEVLRQIMPAVQEVCDSEKRKRSTIRNLGVNMTEKLPPPEAPNAKKKKRPQGEDGDYECEICRMNLFVSMVLDSQEEAVYCLDHAAEQIEKNKIQSKHCKLLYTYGDDELAGLISKINSIIDSKLQKKVPNKFAGMPTLLNK